MKRILPAKKITGTVTLPGDKSISHRAALLGAVSVDGITAHNFSDATGKAMPDGLDEIRASITASRIERFIKHTGTYEDSTRVNNDTKPNIEGEL